MIKLRARANGSEDSMVVRTYDGDTLEDKAVQHVHGMIYSRRYGVLMRRRAGIPYYRQKALHLRPVVDRYVIRVAQDDPPSDEGTGWELNRAAPTISLEEEEEKPWGRMPINWAQTVFFFIGLLMLGMGAWSLFGGEPADAADTQEISGGDISVIPRPIQDLLP